ncbi:MAG: N-acyl-D-amino-acid deacylase family protein [Planctomycetia bacterium]
MFDVVIAGGEVIDGAGGPRFRADVGVTGDRIVAVGNLKNAETASTLGAAGLVVTPGFIDTHVHGDLAALADPRQEAAIRQGITTFLNGQDGCGLAPATSEIQSYMRSYTAGFTGVHPDLKTPWNSVDGYLSYCTGRSSLNNAFLVPNGTVRMNVLGLDARRATPDEIAAMRRLVREGLEQGAVGLSTGLDYIPSLYADTWELIELCKELTPVDGVYVTHVRGGMPNGMVDALEEVWEIGRGSGCLLHISHYNVRADEHLFRIDDARATGLDVTYDSYPYRAGMTILAMVGLPGWIQVGGVEATIARLADAGNRRKVADWIAATPRAAPENMVLAGVGDARHESLVGKTLVEAADLNGCTVAELICTLLRDCRLQASAVVFDPRRTDADLAAVMAHPCQMGGSDGIYAGQRPHPRGWGAYASFLGPFVRDHKAWSLETAVQHLTNHAARRYRLLDRGLVRAGMAADLAVFDPAEVAPRSTYENPRRFAVGMKHVLVNGTTTLRDGEHTGATAGRGLRRM